MTMGSPSGAVVCRTEPAPLRSPAAESSWRTRRRPRWRRSRYSRPPTSIPEVQELLPYGAFIARSPRPPRAAREAAAAASPHAARWPAGVCSNGSAGAPPPSPSPAECMSSRTDQCPRSRIRAAGDSCRRRNRPSVTTVGQHEEREEDLDRDQQVRAARFQTMLEQVADHREAPLSAATGWSRDIRQAGYTPESRPKSTDEADAVQEHAEVHGELRVGDQPGCGDRAKHERREHEADEAADERQHEVLDDELGDERPRRGAERLADANLRGPFHDPADVQVDEVHRRQQQEQESDEDHRAPRGAPDGFASSFLLPNCLPATDSK